MQLRRAKERAIRLQQSDIREVTSGMNPAQKRRWNAYSTRKKQKLFGQARRAAKKKRCYQRAALEEQRKDPNTGRRRKKRVRKRKVIITLHRSEKRSPQPLAGRVR